MKFISVDPSLSNTAIVWGNYSDGIIEWLGYDIAISKKSPNKKMKVMEDRVNRIVGIFSCIDNVIERENPIISFGEYPSGSQSSAAAVSLGISCSILAKLPNLIGVTPMDVKKIVGAGIVDKKHIMKYCENKYPDFNYERKKDNSFVEGRMEHVCDAMVIAEAGILKLNKQLTIK